MICVVGSRKCSEYGRTITRTIARALAQQGITILSGLAEGIDGAAHTGCLDTDGTTIAALAGGVDTIFPTIHTRLYRDILEKGWIISRNRPGAETLRGYFPARNEMMVALCQGVLVVEGTPRSGTSITANVALEMGRELMAVPGNIDSAAATLPNMLLREGAAVVAAARDVMDTMGWAETESPKQYSTYTAPTTRVAQAPVTAPEPLNDHEKKLVVLLQNGPLGVDALEYHSGMPYQELITHLTFLELRGIIKQLPGPVYTLGD